MYDGIRSFVNVESYNMTDLMNAVNVGAVSVVVDAYSSSFEYYKSGVLDSNDCGSGDPSHGVLLVGYGTDKSSGMEYWKLNKKFLWFSMGNEWICINM